MNRWWEDLYVPVLKPLTPRRFYLSMHPYELTQADIQFEEWEIAWVKEKLRSGNQKAP